MAPVPADARNPMILPNDHHIMTILIRNIHEVNGHCGVEQVLTISREQFWIVKARATIKKILCPCVHCQRQMALKMSQLMGELPKVRLTPYEPPFTYCGGGGGLFRTISGEARKRASNCEATRSNLCLREF